MSRLTETTGRMDAMDWILTDEQRDELVEDLLGIVSDVRSAVREDVASVPAQAIEAAGQIASTLLYEDGRRSADADGGEAPANRPDVEAAL